MKNIIAIFIIGFILFGLYVPQRAVAQTGIVPELKEVAESAKILKTEVELMDKGIQEIRTNGGTVEAKELDKFELYKAVLNLLEINSPGMTTFNALASNSNQKNLLQDDEAYQLFLDGHWDDNMKELIVLLSR